jgi:hypothetical protein
MANNTSAGNEPKDDNQMSEELKRNNAAASGNSDDDLPGYPHYPADEDIMNASRDQRVDLDVENLPKRGSQVNVDLKNDMPAQTGSAKDEFASVGDMDDDDIVMVPGTEADLTKEDHEILNAERTDTEQPLNRVRLDKVDEDDDRDQEDLDIPGSEIDDANESIGEEDEENNYYSLGGDRHENLEEDSASTS